VFLGRDTKSGKSAVLGQQDDRVKNANDASGAVDTIFENVRILQVWNVLRRKWF